MTGDFVGVRLAFSAFRRRRRGRLLLSRPARWAALAAPRRPRPSSCRPHRPAQPRSLRRAPHSPPSPPNARRSRSAQAPRRSTSTARARSAIRKDLQYQAVIDKQSRNCVVSNGLITVQMGVVGPLHARARRQPDQRRTAAALRGRARRGAALLREVSRSRSRSRRRRRRATSSRSSRTCRSPM